MKDMDKKELAKALAAPFRSYSDVARKAFKVEPLCGRCGHPLEATRLTPHGIKHSPEECLLNEVLGT